MAREIELKTAAYLVLIIAAISVVGTALILTSGVGGPLVTGLQAGTATVNVSETVSLTLPATTVSFGNQSIGATNQSYDPNIGALSNTPAPFTLQNDGNVWLNITINSAQFWTASGFTGATLNYRYNATQAEVGTLNGTGTANATGYSNYSHQLFKNVPISSAEPVVYGMNYVNTSDSIYVLINITVPNPERPGNRTATVTFTGTMI